MGRRHHLKIRRTFAVCCVGGAGADVLVQHLIYDLVVLAGELYCLLDHGGLYLAALMH